MTLSIHGREPSAWSASQEETNRVHTKGVVRQHAYLEIAFEKLLRRVLRRCLAVGFKGRKGSEKGS